MKLKIIYLILISFVIVWAGDFDFKAFSKKQMQPETAKQLIENYEPEDNTERFKKAMVNHYCNFYDESKAIAYLEESMDIAKALDSLEAKDCAEFMRQLGEDGGIQDSYLPATLSYNDIKEHVDYVLKVLDYRTELCCELRDLRLLSMEKFYLQSIRKNVFRLEYHNEEMLQLIRKIEIEITKLFKNPYQDIRINN